MTTFLTDNLPLLAGAPNGIKKLRELILELAVRGKLVPQDPNDEPAGELLKRIAEEKARLVAEGKIKKQKPLAEIDEEETPFELPINWTWGRLGNLVTESGAGWSPSCEPRPREANEWGVLKVSAVSWGIYQPEENKALPASLEARPEHEVAEGDFLVSRANTAELVARSVVVETTPAHLMLSDKIVRLKLTTLCERRYVNLANSAPLAREYYSRVAGGTSSSMKNVSREQILNLPLALPPLAEQHRIVAKVDELMTLCDRLEAQQADAESSHAQLVQALLDSLTQASDATDFATSWQRLAEHFHTLFTTESSIDALKPTITDLAIRGTLTRSSPLTNCEASSSSLAEPALKPYMVDSSWEWSRMDEVVRFQGGSQPPKSTFVYEPKPGYTRLVQIRDFKSDANQTFIPNERANRLFNVDDVMIGRYGPPVFQILRGLSGTYNVALMKAVPISPKLSKDFLFWLLQERRIHNTVVSESERTAGQTGIRLPLLNSFVVAIPPLFEQERIVAKIEQLMALCDRLKTRLTQARQLNEQLASTLVEQAVA